MKIYENKMIWIFRLSLFKVKVTFVFKIQSPLRLCIFDTVSCVHTKSKFHNRSSRKSLFIQQLLYFDFLLLLSNFFIIKEEIQP